MRIDAHQHFWRVAERGGAWPPPALSVLYRDFLPSHLKPMLARHGITGTVLVQSLPSVEDTRFMLEQTLEHSFIRAVVGWVDLKAADAPRQIASLAAYSKLKGLRPMLQDLDDDGWIDDPALAPAVEAMLHHRLSFDALVQPRHLPALLAFATRFPALPIVIDHAAKPEIGAAWQSAWVDDLARLAALPQVWCKLSGLLTETGPGWKRAALQPYVDHVLAQFGPGRVMWGSDWPVLNLAADYDRWMAVSGELLAGLTRDEREAVYGLNAVNFYRLG